MSSPTGEAFIEAHPTDPKKVLIHWQNVDGRFGRHFTGKLDCPCKPTAVEHAGQVIE